MRRFGVPLVVVGLWLGACTTSVPEPLLEIVSFSADPAAIVVGASSTLSWEVTGATSIVVTDDGDAVVVDAAPASGSQVVSPTETTVYTLTATGPGGVTTQDVTVTVQTEAGAPVIVSFSAVPAAILVGASSTLSWEVTGATSIVVTDDADVVVVDAAPASGSQVVSPTETTVYTLTATGPGGVTTQDVTVTVQTEAAAPEITDFTATVVRGSQVQLSWTATGAVSYDVLAVLDGDPSDTEVLATGLSGTGTTVAIPASDRQRLRLVATGLVDPDDTDELVLQNVVVSSGDYDPYSLQGIVPEPEVTGTLRSVLANAPSGSVVGFASDISTVEIRGVDVEAIGALAVVDAHLVLRDDVVLSGPAGRVTIQGVSGWTDGDPGDPFTYQSRMLFVPAGLDVTLENLVLTGGTFIFTGGAIRNDGNLTIASSVITGNRAWQRGGAIFNFDGAVLDIVDSEITDNRAVTENDEVGETFAIRGGFEIGPLGADGYGGAIYNNPGGTVTVTNSLIANNEARLSGGGIYNDGGTVTLVGTDLTGNDADHNLYDALDLSLASYGGGIYNAGALGFSNGELSTGTAGSMGGGLYHDVDATATLNNVLIADNLAGTAGEDGYGGGILHRFYTGEQGNLSLTVTYAGDNVPEDIYLSDRGPREIAPLALDAAPRPGIFHLPSGIERGDRDW